MEPCIRFFMLLAKEALDLAESFGETFIVAAVDDVVIAGIWTVGL